MQNLDTVVAQGERKRTMRWGGSVGALSLELKAALNWLLLYLSNVLRIWTTKWQQSGTETLTAVIFMTAYIFKAQL